MLRNLFYRDFTMKKIVTVLFILAIFTVMFTGCRRQSDGLTIRNGVLMIGMDIGYPPMEYFDVDGVTPIGFNVDMARAIAAKLDLRPEFINTAWDGIFAGVETNRYDVIISSVTITPARLLAHNFSKPYIANTLAMVLPKGSTLNVRSPEDTAGLNVAFQADTTADFYMEELARRTGLRYIPRRYDQVIHCFEELRLGRVDLIVTDLLVAYNYVAPADSPFEIVWMSPDPEVFGICLRRGNDALTDAINQALTELFDDGTMLRISMDIFGMDLVTEARKTW
jgi:polar amino acid transport system substrate-binding protein